MKTVALAAERKCSKMKIAIIICLILTLITITINDRKIDLRSFFGFVALILFLIRG